MTVARTSPTVDRAAPAEGSRTKSTRPQMPPSDHKPRPYTGPSRNDLLAMRSKYTNPAVFTLYGEPLLIVEGHMQWLFDETGKRYPAMFAGIVTVSCGPRHPKIVDAIQKQGETLQPSTTIDVHPNLPLLTNN